MCGPIGYLPSEEFQINRCHQRVVTWLQDRRTHLLVQFPINRCHQRVVTAQIGTLIAGYLNGFQSIGVTSEW